MEADVKYVKQYCLYGEVFSSETELREHGTNKQQSQSHYAPTRAATHEPLSAHAEVLNDAPVATRKVDKTGLISWLSNKYSVPMQWQQNRIGVSESNGTLFLHDLATAQVIAEHKVSLEKGVIVAESCGRQLDVKDEHAPTPIDLSMY